MALIVSPINKCPTSKSFIAFQDQMERNENDIVWKANGTPGDVFAFVRNGKDVTFRPIVRVDDSSVYLGPELQVWSWGVWIESGGATQVRRTMRTDARILSFLKHK